MRRAVLTTLSILVPLVLSTPPDGDAQTFPGAGEEEPTLAAFGGAVAITAGDVLVGEARTTMRPGLVHVFRRDAGGGWSRAGELVAPGGEPGDGFGAALAADGGTLAVTASAAEAGSRAVHLFRKGEDGEWRQTARLAAADSGEAGFGTALALSGDVLLVGVPGAERGAGVVKAYRRDGDDGWTEGGTLAPADAGAGAAFGAAVALRGTLAVIGAPAPRSSDIGSAFVYRFDADSARWVREAALRDEAVRPRDVFGSGVALAGEEVLVASPRHAGRTGAVFAFRRDPESGEWARSARLLPFDGGPRHAFGSALAFREDEAWVGAPGADGGRGAIYVVSRDGESGRWMAARRIGPDGEDGSRLRFGGSLAAGPGVAATGITEADYGAGAAAIFERDDGADGWTLASRVISEAEGLDPIVGGEVRCSGEGDAALFGCRRVDLVSFLPVDELGGDRGVRVNDIWGWTDPETGREYALVGRVDGTAFVDLGDPARPVYLGELPKTEGSPGSVWRDIKVYEDHAYIVSDNAGAHGVQVFDLTRLRDVDDPPRTFDADARYDRVHSAHNIVINTETGFAYAVGSSSGGETCGGGLHMIDIRDPESPSFAGCFSDPETGRSNTGYTHDAQCVTYRGPDEEYAGREICFGANETALSIADVTDKENPVAVSRARYPSVAYTHQGWLTDDHRYFFLDDELDEISGTASRTRTLVWDVADLDDPQLVTEHLGTTGATDHNLYIRGDTMYQSNYVSGLRVLDVSDPANPVEVGYFDTVPWGSDDPGFGGSWSNYPFFESGVIAVSSMGQGLFLLRKREEGRETVFEQDHQDR